MKMKLIFTGSGSAFIDYRKNWQSNMMFEKNGKKLMIDYGGDARHALTDLGVNHTEIDGVFITHFHNDHIGGLEELALRTYFTPGCDRPKMYLHDEKFVQYIWGSLRNGIQCIEHKTTTLESFFEVIITGDHFVWEEISFDVIQTVHTMNKFDLNPSYGLQFYLNKKKAFISGDTQFAPSQYIKILQDVDIIFHDCETSAFESGVHCHYEKMFTLADDIKAKMWLYHYDDKPFDAVEKGFLGWVERGQGFE